MAFFDAAGNPLTDANAAELQWAGHVVYDASGNAATVAESTVPIDNAGDTELAESEDAPGAEA